MGDELLPKRSLDKNQRFVMINGIYNTKAGTKQKRWSYHVSRLSHECFLGPIKGDELLLKRSLDKNQRLVMINGIYNTKDGTKQERWSYHVSRLSHQCFLGPIKGDELLPERSPDKNQRLVMINGIYNTKDGTKQERWSYHVSRLSHQCFLGPIKGDELLPERSPDKNQRLVMINGIYHVKYRMFPG